MGKKDEALVLAKQLSPNAIDKLCISKPQK